MTRITRWLGIVLLLLAPAPLLVGESVKSLPAPTGYISDFAGVLSPSTKQNLESLCTQVDRQAHAQIAVVTIKTLDNDQTIEEFATELEDKWGVGNKDDRGVLMVLVMTPRKGRIEVGYGLEGILNDAKVGDIGRSMVPAANQGDYNTAVPLGVRQIAGHHRAGRRRDAHYPRRISTTVSPFRTSLSALAHAGCHRWRSHPADCFSSSFAPATSASSSSCSEI